MLHDVIPKATTLCALVNPSSNNAELLSRDLQAAARRVGLNLHVLNSSTNADLEAVFAKVQQLKAGGLVIGTDAFFISRSEALGAMAARHGVPAIFQFRAFAAAGGLMSYGGNLADLYRRSGIYTGRILNGEKPGDLPVQQSTKVDLIINLKTAKALGLAMPQSLLARADEVLQ